jgi:soluble lytic murein transglycosylase
MRYALGPVAATVVTVPLVVALCGTAAGAPPGSQATPPASAAPPVTFSVDDAAPYFADGPAAEAARHLRLEEWGAAADGFAAYVAKHPKARDLAQARFLLGYAAHRAGRFAVAAAELDALAPAYPLLADYCRLYAARAYLALGKASEALARGTQVPSTSVLDGEARLVRAEAARATGDAARAATEYEGYVAAYPGSWRINEVRFHLAEVLDGLGRTDDARRLYRLVYIEAPESWGKRAEAKLTTDEARAFDAPDLVTRAMHLFDQMRNQESERAFLRVLDAPKLTDGLACVARFHAAQSVFKQRDRLRAAPLFDLAIEACKKAKDEDLWVKAMYQGARSWGTRAEKDPVTTKKAIAMFEDLWRSHPTHSYADDARLRQAELLDALKEEAKATELLSGLPDAFPKGDQRGEAMWRLALRAWKRGDVDGAKRWLEAELAAFPREEGWWEAGRTLYWLGRVAARQSDRAAAEARYAQAVREYPLSFYALLALNRLRDEAPAAAEALVEELARDPGDPDGWKFAPRPLFGEPAFRRGVELARLGLGAEAKRELASTGITAPTNKRAAAEVAAALDDDGKRELLWLTAVIYARAGEPGLSHAVPRHTLTDWARTWPTGPNRKRWLLAFPRGYADLIEKHAKLNGQPDALQFAIVREESAFDPLMESFANAIGLTQLTAAPAKRFAQGLPHDRAALRDPAINVTIGARELGDLWKTYAGNAALAIAGYNAGAGAVNRWLRDPERRGLELDEWIESIPYDETRGYTKRVMGSWFAYTWLAAAPLPSATKAAGPAVAAIAAGARQARGGAAEALAARVPSVPFALPRR